MTIKAKTRIKLQKKVVNGLRIKEKKEHTNFRRSFKR